MFLKRILQVVLISFCVSLSVFFLFSCRDKGAQRSAMGRAFEKQNTIQDTCFDLTDIREGGELIVATLSGPETYYEYRGVELGQQYALAEDFAQSEGVKIRIELASDTAELLTLLQSGEVDLIAFQIPKKQIDTTLFQSVNPQRANHTTSWAVRKTSTELAAALQQWYYEGIEEKIEKKQREHLKMSHNVSRRPQAVYLSRSKGVISVYDDLFKQASVITGWDWRLIAAQCYQESAFDPNAKSWAGAQGLMQLMPNTARELGVSPEEVNKPEENVLAGARYLRKLNQHFADIRSATERIRFVLAAYNGGARHIRDAMALARKYGKNDQRWEDVSPFVLGLQEPKYYRDPVVKQGYMIGSETVAYVQSIFERWRAYGGNAPFVEKPTASNAMQTENQVKPNQPVRKNKYSSGVPILSPDDPSFHQMNTMSKSASDHRPSP